MDCSGSLAWGSGMAEVIISSLAKQEKVFSHCGSIFREIKSVCTWALPQRGIPPVLHDSGSQQVALPPVLRALLLPPLFSTQKQIFPFYCFCAFLASPKTASIMFELPICLAVHVLSRGTNYSFY